MEKMKKIKVLVIDDSPFVREILSRSLEMDPDIKVVGTASDPYVARDKILRLKPDVLTLDIEMPRMSGLEFLQKLMKQYPLPVIMISAFTARGSQITLDALEAGAVDFILKPSSNNIEHGFNGLVREIQRKVKAAARVDMSKWNKRNLRNDRVHVEVNNNLQQRKNNQIIAIGASTGGTLAIKKIIERLPKYIPGILVVQHMPAGFTDIFSQRLNNLFDYDIREAKTGDRIIPGRILIAPGDYHMEMKKTGNDYWVHCSSGPKVKNVRPSVDVLFRSVIKCAGANAIGILLTGMGDDGADAMVEMRQAGIRTIAQDEESSVVFGMPKQAFLRGGVEKLVPIELIAHQITKYLKEMSK